MKQIALLFFFFCIHSCCFAQNNEDSFFEKADAFFRKQVWDGKVNYRAIAKNRQQLDSLVKQIAEFKIDKGNTYRTKSFYINAYNILVIKNVINHYPIASVKDVDGFFDSYQFIVAGKKRSLTQLEHILVMKMDKDPRVLFSLCNGSFSSPAVCNVVIPHDRKLNTELDNRTWSFINDADHIKVDDDNKMATVPQLFNWYQTNITATYPTVLDFINKYRQIKIPKTYSINYTDYNWSLNTIYAVNVLTDYSIQNVSMHTTPEIQFADLTNSKLRVMLSDTATSNLNLIVNQQNQKDKFDEELGFRNESRFIESKTFEFRLTDKFYTQKEYYNKRMLPVPTNFIASYNSINLEGTYAFTGKLQGGFLFNSSKSYNDYYPAKAVDFFGTASNKKFKTVTTEFFLKYNWLEKKYRLSTLAYITLPLISKRPNDKVAAATKAYDVGLVGYYDRIPVSFMRMILSGEIKMHYNLSKEKTTFEFNPASRFIFTIFRSKPVKFTAMIDLLFSVNEEQANPFAAVESIAANVKVIYNLDCNLVYQYCALGKSTGAGQAIKLELRYAFQ